MALGVGGGGGTVKPVTIPFEVVDKATGPMKAIGTTAQETAQKGAAAYQQTSTSASQAAQAITKGSQQSTAALKALEGQVDSLKARISQLEKQSHETGAKMAHDWTSTLQGMEQGFRAIAQGIDALAEKSQVITTVSLGFENLTRAAGLNAESYLARLKEATGGTVSELELMKQANTSSFLVGKEIMTKLPELFEIARASARVTGQSVDYLTNSIVLGIGRQSKMILDNLGIIVDLDKVHQVYAKTLGKTSEELTEAEKRTALMNAVIEKGKVLMAAAGEQTKLFGDRIKEVKNEWEAFADSFIARASGMPTAFAEPLAMISLLSEKLASLSTLLLAGAALGALGLGAPAIAIGAGLVAFATGWGLANAAVDEGVKALKAAEDASASNMVVQDEFGLRLATQKEKWDILTKAVDDDVRAMAEIQEIYKNTGIDRFTVALTKAGDAVQKYDEEVRSLTPAWKSGTEELGRVVWHLENVEKNTTAAKMAIVDFANHWKIDPKKAFEIATQASKDYLSEQEKLQKDGEQRAEKLRKEGIQRSLTDYKDAARKQKDLYRDEADAQIAIVRKRGEVIHSGLKAEMEGLRGEASALKSDIAEQLKGLNEVEEKWAEFLKKRKEGSPQFEADTTSLGKLLSEAEGDLRKMRDLVKDFAGVWKLDLKDAIEIADKAMVQFGKDSADEVQKSKEAVRDLARERREAHQEQLKALAEERLEFQAQAKMYTDLLDKQDAARGQSVDLKRQLERAKIESDRAQRGFKEALAKEGVSEDMLRQPTGGNVQLENLKLQQLSMLDSMERVKTIEKQLAETQQQAAPFHVALPPPVIPQTFTRAEPPERRQYSSQFFTTKRFQGPGQTRAAGFLDPSVLAGEFSGSFQAVPPELQAGMAAYDALLHRMAQVKTQEAMLRDATRGAVAEIKSQMEQGTQWVDAQVKAVERQAKGWDDVGVTMVEAAGQTGRTTEVVVKQNKALSDGLKPLRDVERGVSGVSGQFRDAQAAMGGTAKSTNDLFESLGLLNDSLPLLTTNFGLFADQVQGLGLTIDDERVTHFTPFKDWFTGKPESLDNTVVESAIALAPDGVFGAAASTLGSLLWDAITIPGNGYKSYLGWFSDTLPTWVAQGAVVLGTVAPAVFGPAVSHLKNWLGAIVTDATGYNTFRSYFGGAATTDGSLAKSMTAAAKLFSASDSVLLRAAITSLGTFMGGLDGNTIPQGYGALINWSYSLGTNLRTLAVDLKEGSDLRNAMSNFNSYLTDTFMQSAGVTGFKEWSDAVAEAADTLSTNFATLGKDTTGSLALVQGKLSGTTGVTQLFKDMSSALSSLAGDAVNEGTVLQLNTDLGTLNSGSIGNVATAISPAVAAFQKLYKIDGSTKTGALADVITGVADLSTAIGQASAPGIGALGLIKALESIAKGVDASATGPAVDVQKQFTAWNTAMLALGGTGSIYTVETKITSLVTALNSLDTRGHSRDMWHPDIGPARSITFPGTNNAYVHDPSQAAGTMLTFGEANNNYGAHDWFHSGEGAWTGGNLEEYWRNYIMPQQGWRGRRSTGLPVFTTGSRGGSMSMPPASSGSSPGSAPLIGTLQIQVTPEDLKSRGLARKLVREISQELGAMLAGRTSAATRGRF